VDTIESLLGQWSFNNIPESKSGKPCRLTTMAEDNDTYYEPQHGDCIWRRTHGHAYNDDDTPDPVLDEQPILQTALEEDAYHGTNQISSQTAHGYPHSFASDAQFDGGDQDAYQTGDDIESSEEWELETSQGQGGSSGSQSHTDIASDVCGHTRRTYSQVNGIVPGASELPYSGPDTRYPTTPEEGGNQAQGVDQNSSLSQHDRCAEQQEFPEPIDLKSKVHDLETSLSFISSDLKVYPHPPTTGFLETCNDPKSAPTALSQFHFGDFQDTRQHQRGLHNPVYRGSRHDFSRVTGDFWHIDAPGPEMVTSLQHRAGVIEYDNATTNSGYSSIASLPPQYAQPWHPLALGNTLQYTNLQAPPFYPVDAHYRNPDTTASRSEYSQASTIPQTETSENSYDPNLPLDLSDSMLTVRPSLRSDHLVQVPQFSRRDTSFGIRPGDGHVPTVPECDERLPGSISRSRLVNPS
jgi:hypothetical protein